ncbi:MAG: hypothetical protein HOM11_07550 [Methylococcales bacterium]|jgi:hypothetical protein|nr:hypothetical protein [Methylococcales bacterium]MBT7444442.1 hypothetical protein [Methylococcales bacterium]
MKKTQWIAAVAGVAALMASGSVLAAEDLGTLLQRLQGGNFDAALRFITGGLFIVGIVFVGTAALNLKKMGQGQAGQGGVAFRNPVLNVIAGLFLIYLTVFSGIGGQTLFGNAGANSTTAGDVDIN